MPLPMVHFSFALEYFDSSPVPAAFILGSIAPDAIHMRKNSTKDDKLRTHFSTNNLIETGHGHPYLHYLNQTNDVEWKWFVRGYFAHVLLDRYWYEYLNKRLREVVVKEKKRPDELKRMYYQETEQIDFCIYNNASWRKEVWAKLLEAPSFAIEPLLSADEINFWRYRTINWFDIIAKSPDIEPRFVTESVVTQCVKDAVPMIQKQLNTWEMN